MKFLLRRASRRGCSCNPIALPDEDCDHSSPHPMADQIEPVETNTFAGWFRWCVAVVTVNDLQQLGRIIIDWGECPEPYAGVITIYDDYIE